LEEEPLREISRLTGGVYISAQKRTLPLGRVFQEEIANRPMREFTPDSLPQYRQRYSWFFAAGLALITMEMALAGLPVRVPSQGDWSDEQQPSTKEMP